MKASSIRVLVVEDNMDICQILKGFFEMHTEIEFLGDAHDGLEAIEKIYSLMPDVLVMDVIMPICDGLSVLEHLRDNPPAKKPIIILTSAGGHDFITQQSVELGADYFMLKPYSLDILLSRIITLSENSNNANNVSRRDNENVLSRFIISLGVPTHILGYQYMVEALSIMLVQKSPCPIGKKVYSAVAKSNNTTEDCVERAVRQAIVFIYNSKTEVFYLVMNYCNASLKKRPTNAQFLKIVTEYLRLNQL